MKKNSDNLGGGIFLTHNVLCGNYYQLK